MNEILEGTPISLITNAEVKWEVKFSIFPIEIDHALKVAELIAEDDYFSDIDVSMICCDREVTSIVFKSNRLWHDLAEFSVDGELRTNQIIDDYLEANGGYDSARA